MKLKELADIIGGTVAGDPETEITGVCSIQEPSEGCITFLLNKKMIANISDSGLSAVIVSEELKELPFNMLVVDNPHYAFARALEVFNRKPAESLGISKDAIIGTNVSTGNNISIYPSAFISDNVVIGNSVTISPGTYIGEGVSIGDNSFIYPNVTIREKVIIGKNAIVHSGTIIGCDGFGYVLEKGKHYKIPQVGGVIIEDDVEIGANVTIDRATIGNTIIGSGTKIDNLVQIAHNVKIGKNCIIVSQVGISGSVEIGDGVVLAGQVGVRDHVKIGNGAIAGAQAGIGSDIPSGEVYSGSPAIPHKIWLRAQSIYSKLPEYIRRLQQIERQVSKEENSDDEQS